MTRDHNQDKNIDSAAKRNGPGFDSDFRRVSRFEADVSRRLGMTLNQLASFAAVAHYSNLTMASAALRVSQPSISQHLRQLEQSYGVKLYRRLSRGIEITEAGQSFLRDITPILALVAKLGEGSKLSSERLAPKVLSIGGTYGASAVLLPALLARFQLRHRKAELEFRTASTEQLERLVLKSTMDLAVTDRKSSLADLACDPLRRETVLAFVPPGHPLARRKIVNLSDVLAEPLIVRGGRGISGTTENALKRLRNQGWTIKIGMRCDTPGAIKAAVRQKMGVGFAFEDSLKAEIDAGEFKILKVRGLELEVESFIIYSKKRPLSLLAQQFLELLRGVRRTRNPRHHSNASRRSIAVLRSSLSEYSEVSRAAESSFWPMTDGPPMAGHARRPAPVR